MDFVILMIFACFWYFVKFGGFFVLIGSSASGSAQIALKIPPIERYAFSASKLLSIFFQLQKKIGLKKIWSKKIDYRKFLNEKPMVGKMGFRKFPMIFFHTENFIFFRSWKKNLFTVSMQKKHIFRLVAFSERSEHSPRR